jgi:glycosyltransferase involved in cell wall biosynthesis
MNELIAYYESFDSFQQLLAHYDIVQGYATDPLWPLLCGNKPYVAYEHGTLREIPFQDNLIGKLTALAYRLSRHTFITNGDCRECAIRLGVPSLSPTLHGIDDRKFHRNQDLRNQLRRQYGVERLYLCPIRHDWAVKGTDQHIRALPNLVERTGKDFRLILIEWGEMVAQSKELAHSLGVEEQIIWIQPLPKRKLIDWIGAMDCVLDQLTLPHFGATAPEAMGCGIPVISSYDPESTRWIVEEPAPIQSAFTPEQVADRLMELSDPDHWKTVADKCLAWFQRNHSSQRLLRDHLDVYREILKFAESPMSKAA